MCQVTSRLSVYANAVVVLAALLVGDYGLQHRPVDVPRARAPAYRDAPEASSTVVARGFRPATQAAAQATSPAATGG